MAGAFLGIFFAPLFFVVIQRIFGKRVRMEPLPSTGEA